MSTETPLSERLHHVTADDLERLLVESETAIARLRHLQTLVIREADVRQLPLGDGCRTLSEWVSGRADVERSTADALVRVARRQDAELDQALAGGRAGFDRVSVVACTDEADLAPHLDIAGLRRRAVRTHRLSRLDEIRRYGRRSFSYQRDLFGSSGRFWGEGPALETDAIFSAIETAADGTRSSRRSRPPPMDCRPHRPAIPNLGRHAASTAFWLWRSAKVETSRSTPPSSSKQPRPHQQTGKPVRGSRRDRESDRARWNGSCATPHVRSSPALRTAPH